MSERNRERAPRKARRGIVLPAFTLIELLVVIAIIALMISILMPSLSKARKQGMATKCAANLHHVGQAVGSYLADSTGVFPPAYIYPYDGDGNYDFEDQPLDHPYGYMHWSWFLYGRGQVSEEAFQCPAMPHGGAPRTNPGPRGWEEGQVDQNGNSGPPGTVMDRQAERMAYTGNAAIFPRNKFTTQLSGGPRVNVCVSDSHIFDPARVTLVTEWNENWKAAGVQDGGGILSKSHRPVNPFGHISSGSSEYAAPPEQPGFSYGNPPDFGLLTYTEIREATGLIDNPGTMETNAVGRHHPGGDGMIGGTVNFLYADSHVERKTILQSLLRHEWGNHYYAITGKNQVGPPWTE